MSAPSVLPDESYEYGASKQTPSLLTIIIDTNPRAWAALSRVLPQSKAVASLLVFLNAHLACSSTNQAAVIASSPSRAAWLYPSPPTPAGSDSRNNGTDVPMSDTSSSAANKFPPFAHIESTVAASLKRLNSTLSESDLSSRTTQMAGALTLALAYANKANLALTTSKAGANAAQIAKAAGTGVTNAIHSRILVVSVSDAAPSQYIATMNAVFAAAHAQVAIDVLALRGDSALAPVPAPPHTETTNGTVFTGTAGVVDTRTTFLQQAAYITSGTYLSVPSLSSAVGLLTYLMFGFADADARDSLVSPTQDSVDFRAACFCHRKVVDTGYVCSICLSIFCEPPRGAAPATGDTEDGTGGIKIFDCLTCGTPLSVGEYGSKPALQPRRKKKRKRPVANGNGDEDSTSATGTPNPR